MALSEQLQVTIRSVLGNQLQFEIKSICKHTKFSADTRSIVSNQMDDATVTVNEFLNNKNPWLWNN